MSSTVLFPKIPHPVPVSPFVERSGPAGRGLLPTGTAMAQPLPEGTSLLRFSLRQAPVTYRAERWNCSHQKADISPARGETARGGPRLQHSTAPCCSARTPRSIPAPPHPQPCSAVASRPPRALPRAALYQRIPAPQSPAPPARKMAAPRSLSVSAVTCGAGAKPRAALRCPSRRSSSRLPHSAAGRAHALREPLTHRPPPLPRAAGRAVEKALKMRVLRARRLPGQPVQCCYLYCEEVFPHVRPAVFQLAPTAPRPVVGCR